MQTKKLAGILFTLFVAVLPVALWLVFYSGQLDLGGTSQRLDALAKITALSGISLLSFNIILSARLSVFDRLFLGLDRAYRAHRIIGGSVLMLLLVHGALITAKYSSISLLSGYEFLKPSTDIPLMAGKLALVVMIFAIVISVYIKVKYQWFISLQRLLGAMVFLGGFHALFVTGSDIRANVPLFVYFTLIGGAAAGLYVYRSLFHKSIKRKLDYTVKSVTYGEDITTMWLQPSQKALAFYAGQFAFFQFHSQAVGSESHPFSISSSSDSDNIRIAAKNSGDYTAELRSVEPGDIVQVEGPYGGFSFTKVQSTKQVWVAGGIGITPFVAMAASLPAGYDITLYYCVRTASQAVFLGELESIARKTARFRVVLICNDRNQRVSASDMTAQSAGAYLLCAPPAMMYDIEMQLSELGVPKSAVYYEDFSLV